MNTKRIALVATLLTIAGANLFGQNRTAFAGLRNAVTYAYGLPNGPSALRVDIGTTATGAGTLTLSYGYITLGDGTVINPLATTAPITVGIGSNAETVTPSAVSCTTPQVYDTCTVTATFSNTHGRGDLVTSGTYGLTEAVNAAHTYGGLVAVDGYWKFLGGVTGTITGNKGWANVTVLDWRGATTAKSYAATDGANYVVTAISLY